MYTITAMVDKNGNILIATDGAPIEWIGQVSLTPIGNYIAEWAGLDGIQHRTYPRLTAEDACRDVVKHDYPNARFAWAGSDL